MFIQLPCWNLRQAALPIPLLTGATYPYRVLADTDVHITWPYCGDDTPGSKLLLAIERAGPRRSAAAGCAAAAATGLRRHLVTDSGRDGRACIYPAVWPGRIEDG